MSATGKFRFTPPSRVVCVLALNQIDASHNMFGLHFAYLPFEQGLALAHRFFSPVVRLAKRWVHAHLFSNHVRGPPTPQRLS